LRTALSRLFGIQTTILGGVSIGVFGVRAAKITTGSTRGFVMTRETF